MTNGQTSEYFYADGGTPRGPLSAAELRAMASEGRIGPETLVWRPGLADWVRYRELAETELAAVGQKTARRCVECGQLFSESEMVRLGSAWACGGCKALVAQRLLEQGQLRTGAAFAGFWARFAAAMLDSILMAVAYYSIYIPVMWSAVRRIGEVGSPTELVTLGGVVAVMWLLSVAMFAVYEIWMVGRFGATLGKMALRLRVVRADGSPLGYGRAAGRHFAKYLSQLTAGVGYLLAAFDREKRALHDMVADTRVIRT
ncbi:MAG: RDD family protein [Kiritimatiellae bacterium]|nr:RDD family protein [Kiritimatiellia bacterium]